MNVLLDVTIKASIILLFALVGVALMRRRSAALRHWVLAVALLCAAAAPIVQLVVPTWELPDALTPRTISRADVSGPTISWRTADGVASARREPEGAAKPALSIATALTATWLAGVLVCLASLVVGLVRLARVASHATRIEDGAWADRVQQIRREHGLRRPVTLLETNDPALLITWGFRQPKVIVPVAAREWRDDRMSLVLHHELAHVRRGDWGVQLAAELMRAVYWFNPIIWITCGRLRQESERACDDAVIGRGVEGSEYATHLVEIARDLQPRASWMPAPAMARPSSLERRVRAMLDTRLDRQPLSRRTSAAALVALLLMTTAIAGFAGAQGFASLAGSIVDPTNGVLPGVTLVLTNERTGAKYELRSDRTGRYEFVGLPAAEYALEARVPGFAVFQGKVTLTGQNVEQNLTLQVGSIQETVTVVASDSDVPSLADPEKERLLDERRQKRAATKCPEAPGNDRARIGGNLRPPMKLRDVRPTYPASLRGSGTAGAVVLKARIGTDGIVDELTVVSSPHPDLAASASDAVGRWEFDATLLNCVAVPVAMTVTVTYQLRH